MVFLKINKGNTTERVLQSPLMKTLYGDEVNLPPALDVSGTSFFRSYLVPQPHDDLWMGISICGSQ